MTRGPWFAAGVCALAGCAMSRPARSEVPPELREFVEARARAARGSGRIGEPESLLLDVSARVPATTELIAGVRLTARRVRARLERGFAHTVIEDELVNETANELEGRLVFRLPPRAVLGRVTLWVDGVPVEAAVVEKQRGRAVYGAIVDKIRRDPALVELLPGHRVSLRVFPLPPGQSRRVGYAYDEPLDEGPSGLAYRLPLLLPAWARALDELAVEVELLGGDAPPVSVNDAEARVEQRPGRTLVTRRGQRVRPSDLVVTLPGVRAPAVAVSTPDGAPNERVAALTVNVPNAAAAEPPNAVAIVVDTSAGQRGEALARSVQLAYALVAGLERKQRFALLGCDSACTAYPSAGLAAATAGDLDAARSFLGALTANGASDVVAALAHGRERLEGARRAQLVMFGDMQPSAGAFVTVRAGRLDDRGLDVRLVGLGAGVDAGRLARFSSEIGAARLLLAPGERSAERLRHWLAAPSLAASALALPPGVSELADGARRVVAGDAELVLGRATSGFRGPVNARSFDGPARLWASSRMGEWEAREDGAPASEIVSLARRYGVLSERTSLIALESAAEFRRFGIGRHGSGAPTVRMAGSTVSGRLPPEAIQRTVRENFGAFRACYHAGLLRNRALEGRVTTRFIIARDGSVREPYTQGSDLADAQVSACVARAFGALRFTPPEGGIVVVVYPLRFSPARGSEPPRALPPAGHRRHTPPAGFVSDRPPATFSVVRAESDEERQRERQQREYERERVASLREDVAQAPRSEKFRRELVRELLASGRFAEARAEASRFVADLPVSLVALEVAADAAVVSGDLAEAGARLAQAVELEPLDVERQRRAALVYEAGGDGARACAHFRAAATLEPRDRGLVYQAFRCRAQNGAGRLELLAELDAIVAPPGELETLRRVLTDQREIPRFSARQGGDFSARVDCAAPGACPTPVFVNEDGEVTAPAYSGVRHTGLLVATPPSGFTRLYLAGEPVQGDARVIMLRENTERQVDLGPEARVELDFRN